MVDGHRRDQEAVRCREQGPQQEPEGSARDRPPGDREDRHDDRLVLVVVDVVDVDDHQQRHHEGARGQRQREVAEGRQDQDHRHADGQRGLEGDHVRLRQSRQQRRDQAHRDSVLGRVGRESARARSRRPSPAPARRPDRSACRARQSHNGCRSPSLALQDLHIDGAPERWCRTVPHIVGVATAVSAPRPSARTSPPGCHRGPSARPPGRR